MALSIGIPKEIKVLEHRVALNPAAVRSLSDKGIVVWVQEGAGSLSGYSDGEYRNAGARLVPDAASLYGNADIVQKVKEPLKEEFPFFRKGLIIFCFLHLASPENCALVNALLDSGVTAIGYETVEEEGRLPLLAPMSHIAGRLAAIYAAALLSSEINTASEIAAAAKRYPQLSPGLSWGSAIIFGGGVAGQAAYEVSQELKGNAAIIEKNPERLNWLKRRDVHAFGSLAEIHPLLMDSRILIGAAHALGQRAANVLSAEELRAASLQKKKILVDIAIDQGGNFPDARSTSYERPVYTDSDGNIRFAVPNIPSLAGKGATDALTRESVRFSEILASNPDSISTHPVLMKAVNIRAGKILLPSVLKAHQRF